MSAFNRDICYHQNPNDDTKTLWGVDYTKTNAKPAKQFCCPNDGCKWPFTDTEPGSKIWAHVVGYCHYTKAVTLRCPKCNQFMWVHTPMKYSESVTLQMFVGVVRAVCPNWPIK